MHSRFQLRVKSEKAFEFLKCQTLSRIQGSRNQHKIWSIEIQLFTLFRFSIFTRQLLFFNYLKMALTWDWTGWVELSSTAFSRPPTELPPTDISFSSLGRLTAAPKLRLSLSTTIGSSPGNKELHKEVSTLSFTSSAFLWDSEEFLGSKSDDSEESLYKGKDLFSVELLLQ